MTCTHDIVERDIAISADGMCPLCLAAENAKFIIALEAIIHGDPYDGPSLMDIADNALKAYRARNFSRS